MIEGEPKFVPEKGQHVEKPELERFDDFVEQEPFEHLVAYIGKDEERRPPTQEEKEKMTSYLQQLSGIFAGSDIRWHLDGAINISLREGEFIGIHKDVDISIEIEDLEKLEQHLRGKGYDLFVRKPKDPNNPDGEKILVKADSAFFKESTKKDLLAIVAITEEGKLSKEERKLRFIDTHLIKRDAGGAVVDKHGLVLPKEWAEPQKYNFQDHYSLNLAHPAEIAYFKLYGKRKYDITDIRRLAKYLSPDDVLQIEQVFEGEFASRKKRNKESIEYLFNKVIDKIKPGMTPENIFDVFINEPEIAAKTEKNKTSLQQLSERLSRENDITYEKALAITSEIFDIENKLKEKRDRIANLKQWTAKEE